MSEAPETLSSEVTPQEQGRALRRILDILEKRQRVEWAEIVIAVMLALAAMGSAWCAYQSTLWGGVQTFRLADANRAGRAAAENTIAAFQFRTFDASMFIDYATAHANGNKELEQFLYQRFRPEMKKAVDAWLVTHPLRDPAAPSTPFKMAEYQQPEQHEAKRQHEESDKFAGAAQQANENSDRYVLLTVMFASVLFFGGIAGTIQSRRLRITTSAIGLVAFLVTVGVLVVMPVCRE